MTKREAKVVDERVNRAYTRSCQNISIDIFDIEKVFVVGRDAISHGADDATLEKVLRTFVETIRKD